MSYHVTHRTGEMEADFPAASFGTLLDELSLTDGEHPDVAVTHESEWSLAVNGSGYAILEHLEQGSPLHMGPLPRVELIDLMVALAEGRIEELRKMPWRRGYPMK